MAADYGHDSIRMTYCNRAFIVEGGRGSRARDAAWLEACRRIPDQRHVQTYDVVVPARTLSSILDDRGLSEIDFMSLDLRDTKQPPCAASSLSVTGRHAAGRDLPRAPGD